MQALAPFVALTPASAVVLTLVLFIGAVIVRYSRRYLDGQPNAAGYGRWLAVALAAVVGVVVSNHLLLTALAWMLTSLALHRLLLFFGERPAARRAAHKKFVLGRIADIAMFSAVGLFGWSLGTMRIDELGAIAAQPDALPAGAQAAVLLVVVAALLKCAQLPFHGWLIQVMEAPTPVSALLHAGVVNLGGFVLIRLAPLVADVFAAQALLVLAGTFTAVVAAMVMTTRISIKVSLAWSTAAQMGFMLLQCGLGAWEMALVHLVAHSLYKAHAFLSSGGVVRHVQVAELAPRLQPTLAATLAGGAIGVSMTLLAGVLFQVSPADPAVWVLGGIVALALAPLARPGLLMLGAPFVVASAYFALHALTAGWVVPAGLADAPLVLWGFVALAFAALFALQAVVAARPQGRLATTLYPWFYGGLFLDERLWRPGARTV